MIHLKIQMHFHYVRANGALKRLHSYISRATTQWTFTLIFS